MACKGKKKRVRKPKPHKEIEPAEVRARCRDTIDWVDNCPAVVAK